jgi:hypothetical protein
MIAIEPFANDEQTYDSRHITIENGKDGIYLEVAGYFWRDGRELTVLKDLHDFLGRMIDRIETQPSRAPFENDTPAIVDNPFRD